MTNMTVRMEEGLRMSRAIASLIATHLQLDPEDARGGAEAIWELLRQVEYSLFEEDKMSPFSHAVAGRKEVGR